MKIANFKLHTILELEFHKKNNLKLDKIIKYKI